MNAGTVIEKARPIRKQLLALCVAGLGALIADRAVAQVAGVLPGEWSQGLPQGQVKYGRVPWQGPYVLGYNYNLNFNDPFGGIGRTLADQELWKQQMFAESAGRQNLMAAQSTREYGHANLMNHQAIGAALSNVQEKAAMESYQAAVLARYKESMARRQGARHIPIEQLLSVDGTVLWPKAVARFPDLKPKRAAVEAAVGQVITELGESGCATLESVSVARSRLSAYGRPVVTRLRVQGPRTAAQFQAFLLNLDVALQDLTAPAIAATD